MYPQSSFASSFSFPPPSPSKPTQPSERGATDVSSDAVPELIIGEKENVNANAPDPIVNKSEQGAKSEDPSAAAENAVSAASNDDEEAAAKKQYDDTLAAWRKESAEARSKSESTRLRHEEEEAKAREAEAEGRKLKLKQEREAKEQQEIERKLQEELAKSSRSSRASASAKVVNKAKKEQKEKQRWEDVRDAWEIVKEGETKAGSSSSLQEGQADRGIAAPTDARDIVPGDEGGRDGNRGPEVLEVSCKKLWGPPVGHRLIILLVLIQQIHAATQAVTHASGTNDPTPRSAAIRSELLPASSGDVNDRREEVGKAWQKVHGPGATEQSLASSTTTQGSTRAPTPQRTVSITSAQQSSGGVARGSKSGEKKSAFPDALPEAATNEPPTSDDDGPPKQPPSLALSLFTMPSHRSLLRITAVLGINLVLPFINGVMLGFGEIFARETVQWTRRWWRGEVGLGRSTGWVGPGSHVAAVGLREGAERTDASSADFP